MRNVIALRILRKHLKGRRVPIFLKNPFACSTPTFHRVTGHDRGTISLSPDDSNCPAKSFHKVFFLPSSCLDADSTKVEVLFSRRDHACCRNGAIIIEFSTRCELPRRNLGCSAGHARVSEYPRAARHQGGNLHRERLDLSFPSLRPVVCSRFSYTWPLVIRISRYLRTYRVR